MTIDGSTVVAVELEPSRVGPTHHAVTVLLRTDDDRLFAERQFVRADAQTAWAAADEFADRLRARVTATDGSQTDETPAA